MSELLRINYLFGDYRRFPWDIFGLSVPKAGPVHSYLTSILAPWGPPDYREFMTSHPSWSEVQRAAMVTEDKTLSGIVGYCSWLYDRQPRERSDVAQEVLNFLFRYVDFHEHVQKTLDRLYLSGLISIPAEVRPKANDPS